MKKLRILFIVPLLLPFLSNAQITVLRTTQVAGGRNYTAGNYSGGVTFGQAAVSTGFAAGNYTGNIGFLSATQSSSDTHYADYAKQGELYNVVLQEVSFGSSGITLQVGDEVGLFDGPTLVGHGAFTGVYPISCKAYLADPSLGIPGATNGSVILFKVWRAENGMEYDGVPTIISGSGGHFGDVPATNVTVLTVAASTTFTYSLQANRLYYLSPALATETTTMPDVFGGFAPYYMQGNKQLYVPELGLSQMDFLPSAGYRYFHTEPAEIVLSGNALTGGQTVSIPAKSVVYIPYPYSSEHTFEEVFGSYIAPIYYMSDNNGIYIELEDGFVINTIALKPGVAYKIFCTEAVELSYPVLTNSAKKWDTKTPQYVEGSTPFNKSGELYVVVFEGVENLSVGDEVLAYSNGECFGSAHYTGQNPFYLQTYIENKEQGIKGAKQDTPIELFVKHKGSLALQTLSAQFKQGGLFGSGLYSIADIKATKPLSAHAFDLEMAVFPNPFSEQVSIQFKVPSNAEAAIHILDITGKIVERVENFASGQQQYVWNPSNAKPGVFFCKLYINGVPAATQKLVLNR